MFKLTGEQREIIKFVKENQDKDLVVNAFAGTGKTTTIRFMVQEIDETPKPVYIVYNKRNREEAQKKIGKKANVQTFHSLAYSYLKKEEKEKVKKLSFAELKEIIERVMEKTTEINRKKVLYCTYGVKYYMAGNIKEAKKFFKFAKIDKEEVAKIVDRVIEEQIRGKIDFDTMILKLIREIENGERTRIKRKTIIVDEAQDINPWQEKLISLIARRVIAVGDTHQAIYSWRGASGYFLRRGGVERKYLTISWRIPPKSLQEEIANKLLTLKGEKKRLRGMNLYEDAKKTKAIIARKNISLIDIALDYAKRGEPFKFVRPLEEILGLPIDLYRYFYLKETPQFHKWLFLFKKIEEIEKFAEENEDTEILIALDFIKKYNPIVVYKTLTESQSWRGIELTTAHSAKGLEWSKIEMIDDFPDLIAEAKKLQREEGISFKQAWERIKKEKEEEINLLYVAVTRAREELTLPSSLWIFDIENLEEVKNGTSANK